MSRQILIGLMPVSLMGQSPKPEKKAEAKVSAPG